jgi:hypothetical protein
MTIKVHNRELLATPLPPLRCAPKSRKWPPTHNALANVNCATECTWMQYYTFFLTTVIMQDCTDCAGSGAPASSLDERAHSTDACICRCRNRESSQTQTRVGTSLSRKCYASMRHQLVSNLQLLHLAVGFGVFPSFLEYDTLAFVLSMSIPTRICALREIRRRPTASIDLMLVPWAGNGQMRSVQMDFWGWRSDACVCKHRHLSRLGNIINLQDNVSYTQLGLHQHQYRVKVSSS